MRWLSRPQDVGSRGTRRLTRATWAVGCTTGPHNPTSAAQAEPLSICPTSPSPIAIVITSHRPLPHILSLDGDRNPKKAAAFKASHLRVRVSTYLSILPLLSSRNHGQSLLTDPPWECSLASPDANSAHQAQAD